MLKVDGWQKFWDEDKQQKGNNSAGCGRGGGGGGDKGEQSAAAAAAASSSHLSWEAASDARLFLDPKNVPAKVFPRRFQNMILHMPVVIVVLTYEGSNGIQFQWPGLSEYKHIAYFGRAAALEPVCPKKHCVSHGMTRLLKFMTNKVWDADTRFIFMEEDWRPHDEHGDVSDPMSPKAIIENMVQVAITADEHGMGDFVWLSWERNDTRNHKKRKNRSDRSDVPQYGNLVQVYTVPFARRLLEDMEGVDTPLEHWDVFLRGYLTSTPNSAVTARTCFCKPALGGFYNHKSGCEEQIKGDRICDWTAGWRVQLLAGQVKTVELTSFDNRTVEHSFDTTLHWRKTLRRRSDEEVRLSGVWSEGLLAPSSSEPKDERIFAGKAPVQWTKREKRRWREFRSQENLRAPGGVPDVEPGQYFGHVTGDTFASASPEEDNTGSVRYYNPRGQSGKTGKNSQEQDSLRLPSKLYMYWEQGWSGAPSTVQMCVEKAIRLLEGTCWRVNFVEEASLHEYLMSSDMEFYWKVGPALKPQARSDLVRLMILQRHAGVWCDASNVLTDNLEWLSRIFDNESAPQIFAFTSPQQVNTVLKNGCEVPLLENHPPHSGNRE